MKIQHKDGTPKGLQFKQIEFKADAVNDDGTFTGYGSVFGNVDQGGDIVAPGAFTEWLKGFKASADNPLPALWQHRSGEPIGGYTKLKEDSRGLYVEGFLLKDSVPRAAEAYALMKARVVRGMSIGYMVRDDSYDKLTNVRTLKRLDLAEISVVTFAMNTEAMVETVKSQLESGKLPTLPEFEKFLRDAGGFSKSQATAIAGGGLRQMLRSESDGKSSVLDAIKSITF